MLEFFNTNGWKCLQTKNDKSLFKFVSPKGHITLATLHSDDVDLVCENPNDGVVIADAFNTRFGGKGDGIKMCDPSFMLGVKRNVFTDKDGTTYIEESSKCDTRVTVRLTC